MTTNKLQISKTELKADLPRIYQASELSGDFLRDESKLQGNAEYIAFPRSTMETAAVMKWCSEQGLRVTISGGRTGIAGGAVPNGGLLLSLTKMQKQEKLTEFEDGNSTIYCESGVLLSDLRNNLLRLKSKCFFPPDPTETSATIGGMIACNASGAHTYRYGPTRDYVNAIKVVLADGNILEIRCNARL
jgi:D-lactate dehydrogenase (cytochrome)